MKVKICSLALAGLTIVVGLESFRAFASNKGSKQAKAEALFHAAYSSSSIEAKGSPAFRLEAQLEYRGSNSQVERGSYIKLWSSPGEYETTFSVPAGSETNGHLNGRSWRKSTLPYTTYIETLVERAMDFGTMLETGPPAQLKSVKEETFASESLTCVTPREASADQFCFDPRSGRLVRTLDGTWDVAYQYSDYRPWGNKYFPHEIWVVIGEGPIVEIHVEELASGGTLDVSAFAPPPDAMIEGNHPCVGKITKGRAIQQVPPKYPEIARTGRISGLVRLYADIGESGEIRGLQVIQSASPLLNAAALEAVRQWRFQPTLCDGVPEEIPLPIEVYFQLQQ